MMMEEACLQNVHLVHIETEMIRQEASGSSFLQKDHPGRAAGKVAASHQNC